MSDAAFTASGNAYSIGCAFGGPAAHPDQVVLPILAQRGGAATTSPEFSTPPVSHAASGRLPGAPADESPPPSCRKWPPVVSGRASREGIGATRVTVTQRPLPCSPRRVHAARSPTRVGDTEVGRQAPARFALPPSRGLSTGRLAVTARASTEGGVSGCHPRVGADTLMLPIPPKRSDGVRIRPADPLGSESSRSP